MLHIVDIRYPQSQLEMNKRRLEAAYKFDCADRVPVLLGVEARYLLKERGVSFAEYFSDVRTQLIQQVENIKWRIEHVPDDWFAEPKVTVFPDFQNVTNSAGCGCEVLWQENETPQTIPCISSLEELMRYELPDWRQTLWGKRLEWFREMQDLADQVVVRLNGERIPVEVNVAINGDSPFMAAVDMVGANFYVWLSEAPEACKLFLKKITDRFAEVESEYRRAAGKQMQSGIVLSDDSAQVISLESYREFCVPAAKEVYDIFGSDRYDGRVMHLCGRNVHLHDALLNDLHITMLSGYGSENKPEEMSLLAGKTLLHGNISPMTLFQGSLSEIENAAHHLLEVLAPFGGIILGDGFNVVPETPLSNLEILRTTSAAFGVPRVPN